MLSSTRHEVRIVQLLGLAEAGQRFQQLGDARGWCAVETSRDLRGGDGDGCRRERGADGLRLVGHTRRPGEAGARLLIGLVSGASSSMSACWVKRVPGEVTTSNVTIKVM